MNQPLLLLARLATLVLAIGCNVDLDGELGVVQFSDMTKRPNQEFSLLPASVERAVTPESIYRIKVTEANLSAQQLSTSDDEILKIVDVRPFSERIDGADTVTATEIVMHTGHIGRARLTVELADGRQDYVVITVMEEASTEVVLAPGKQRFIDENGESLVGSQVVLLPDAEIQLFAHTLDSSGGYLSGSNSNDWVIEGPGLVLRDDSTEDDFVRVRATSERHDNRVRFGRSSPVSIATVHEQAVSQITIIPQIIGEPKVGDAVLLHVAFHTQDGRLVVGDAREPVQITVNDGLRLTNDIGTNGYSILSDMLFRPDTNSSRNVFIQADSAGEYSIRADWEGLTHEQTITIR